MTDWDIEAWQLSILVTAAIVLVEAAVNALLRRRLSVTVHRNFRTAALAALVLLTMVVFVAALGPTRADELSSVAAAVAAVVALWLTYRSYHSPKDQNLGGTGAPAFPRTNSLSAPPTPAPTEPPGSVPPDPDDPAADQPVDRPPAPQPLPRPTLVASARRLRRLLPGRKPQRRR